MYVGCSAGKSTIDTSYVCAMVLMYGTCGGTYVCTGYVVVLMYRIFVMGIKGKPLN